MKEKHAVRENLVFSWRGFVCTYSEALPNHIVGEVVSASANQRPDVRAHCFKALHRTLCPQDRLMTRALHHRELPELIAPFDKLCPIGMWQSQQFANHVVGEPLGVITDYIHRPTPLGFA